jgi:hypothetical protein
MKMSKFQRVGVAALAGLLAIGSSVRAATIDSSYYFAYFNPGNPADVTTDSGEAAYAIAQYNAANFGTTSGTTVGSQTYSSITIHSIAGVSTLPTVPPVTGSTIGLNISYGGGPLSVTLDLGSGYEFLLAKWDNRDVIYYIAGLTGIVTLVNDGIVVNAHGDPQGLSGVKTWNATPDGGSTVALLGFALLGIGAVRRKLSGN